MPRASDRTWAAQTFLQFLLQSPASLVIEAAIYRFVWRAVLLFIRISAFEPTCDFLRGPFPLQLSRYQLAQRVIERELTQLEQRFAVPGALIRACCAIGLTPPFLRTSRLIVEGDRFRFCAIERIDCFVTSPREISSRPVRLKAYRDRVRSAGLIPPVRAKCGKIEDDTRLK